MSLAGRAILKMVFILPIFVFGDDYLQRGVGRNTGKFCGSSRLFEQISKGLDCLTPISKPMHGLLADHMSTHSHLFAY